MNDKERESSFFRALIPGLLIVSPLFFGGLIALELLGYSAKWSNAFLCEKVIEALAVGFFYAVLKSERKKNPPNQAPEPTPTAGTPPAGQEARQP